MKLTGIERRRPHFGALTFKQRNIPTTVHIFDNRLHILFLIFIVVAVYDLLDEFMLIVFIPVLNKQVLVSQ